MSDVIQISDVIYDVKDLNKEAEIELSEGKGDDDNE